jgi:hypothetical protein
MRALQVAKLVVVLAAIGMATTELGAQPQSVSYQGELRENGAPVSGVARMKFVIVRTTTSLWSNDNSSVNGSQPATSVDVQVTSGIFSVLLGASPMVPLTADALAQATTAVLRIWVDAPPFNTFEQLSDVPLASAAFALQSDAAKRAIGNFPVRGDLYVDTPTGQRTVTVDPADGSTGGLVRIHDLDAGGQPKLSIELDSREGTAGGTISLHNGVEGGANPNQLTVQIDASEGTGPGQIILYDNQGNIAIELDAERSDGLSRVVADVVEINGGMDLSEQFDIDAGSGAVEPGMVVSIDPSVPGRLRPCAEAYDRRVAGVVSGAGGVNPGMVMGQRGSALTGDYPVALTGRVYCRADAAHGAIAPGDLLCASPTTGHAMKVTDFSRSQGAILGKAMSGLAEGQGLVLVLVSLQ